jgi:superfamily II DNA or RNA helicase
VIRPSTLKHSNFVKGIIVYKNVHENISVDFSAEKNVLADLRRNKTIVSSLKDYYEDNSIIVLTTLRDHMKALYDSFVNLLSVHHKRREINENLYVFGDYHVMMADAKNKNIYENCNYVQDKKNLVLFSTYKLCATGFNMPNLNMIVFASSSINDITFMQSVGRIMRSSRNPSKYAVFFKEIEINNFSKEVVLNFTSDINNQILTLKREGWSLLTT